MAETAGQRLRGDLDRALARAARETGQQLEFSEVEAQLIEWAADAVDTADQLQTRYDAELAGEQRPTTLVKLSAEIRTCRRAAADWVGRVEIGDGRAKSPRHVRAGQARWNRPPAVG
ncbi:hypothetical protein [Mycolicibacterium pyrenivorans]|uniref:hypothetical protein n=1 Tax=Mycolicibacterium pyrenivorans TaxID=187102 RepID=UPI0021F392E7|nr:hypothetical protein [Mycolicibacterium pyrenivorans]MCV7150534.1 hypothetical protein [Mycolicibacterium pyrenivorans]